MLKRWRIALGAAVGAFYAVLLFVPGLGWLGAWPCKLLSGALMPLIAYGGEQALLRVTLLFFGASAGLAGLVLAVELLGGAGLTLQNGVLYSDFDLRLLLLLFFACYFVMSFGMLLQDLLCTSHLLSYDCTRLTINHLCCLFRIGLADTHIIST